MLEFPSTSQVPTCVHPAPKRNNNNIPAAADEGRRSEAEEPDAGTGSTFDCVQFTEVLLKWFAAAPEKNLTTHAVQRSLSAGTGLCFL